MAMNHDRLGRPNPQVGRVLLYAERIEFYLSPDQLTEIDAMAKAKNVTRPELIRTYIEWGLELDSKEAK